MDLSNFACACFDEEEDLVKFVRTAQIEQIVSIVSNSSGQFVIFYFTKGN